MTARATLVALTGTALLAAGCSSGATYQPPASAAGALQTDVLALTRAAATHDKAATQTAITRLRADLAAARAADAVSATRLAAIERALAAVSTDLAAATRPATSTPPSPTPAKTTPTKTAPTKTAPKPSRPAPAPPRRHKKHGPHDH